MSGRGGGRHHGGRGGGNGRGWHQSRGGPNGGPSRGYSGHDGYEDRGGYQGGRGGGGGGYGPGGGGGGGYGGPGGGGGYGGPGGGGGYGGPGGGGGYGGPGGGGGYGGPGGGGGYGGQGGRGRGYGGGGGGNNQGYPGPGGRGGDRGGGRGGDRGGDRGGGRGRGGRGRGPDLSGIKSVLSNIILANVTQGFQFFLYSIDCQNAKGEQIDSRHRRRFLFDLGFWDGILKDMPAKDKEDLRRIVFFSGSFFFSGRQIPGIDSGNLPMELPLGDKAEGDSIRIVKFEHYLAPAELTTSIEQLKSGEVAFDKRCANCTKAFVDVGSLLQHCQQAGHQPIYVPDEKVDSSAKPAQLEVFVAFVNLALDRALGERLARWGNEFIDPQNMTEPKDRRGESLGVRVYEAFSCSFGLLRTPTGTASLSLTVDLRAKVVRTLSLLNHFCGTQDPKGFNLKPQEQAQAKRQWIGEVVISMHDKRCYSVVDLIFDKSAATMPVEGLGMSHAEYFEKRKGITLKYPTAVPMVAVLGRKNQTIFLPPEIVAGNELERRVKEQLPMIASFTPEARNKAIDKIRAYLVPGAQKSKGAGGMLPALGIQLHDGRLSAKAHVMPVPRMLSAGVEIPSSRGDNWAPLVNKADFNINPGQANTLNVILVYHERLEQGAETVYGKIRSLVNNMNSQFRLSNRPIQMVRAGDNERHWGAVEKCLGGLNQSHKNIFLLDFNNPKGPSDLAYPVIKRLLASNGYLSQFVNFKNYSHDQPKDVKRSSIILQGVARQILQKTGVRLWWVSVPRSLPTPCVFVGVDVFHAPRMYDPVQKKKVAKGSCAAIIVQVFRGGNESSQMVEIFSKTFAREPGKEYDLGDALKTTVSTALRELNVSPQSCVVWRDGIGISSIEAEATEEINGVKAGLNNGGPVGSDVKRNIPLSYIICQKRIDTKLLAKGVAGEPDGKYAAPSGTLVEGIQGLEHDTFYINGNAPPYSTAKPVRFIVVHNDKEMEQVPLPELTWDLCHDYPNWTGPIKVPSVVQMAHKLAELGGSFTDVGSSINASKFKNTIHFL